MFIFVLLILKFININLMEEKLVIVTTTGPENPEKATLPFVIATAAQTVDTNVVVILQSSAVLLAKKGIAEHALAPGLMPVKKLMDTYVELGGELLLCSPCIKERNISPEDLVPGCKTIAAATVVDEVMTATAVLNY